MSWRLDLKQASSSAIVPDLRAAYHLLGTMLGLRPGRAERTCDMPFCYSGLSGEVGTYLRYLGKVLVLTALEVQSR